MGKPFRDGKIHVLAGKCSTCVFRPGNLMHLQDGRKEDMARHSVENDTAFACHQTLYGQAADEAICRGLYDVHRHEILPLALGEAMEIIEFDPIPEKTQ